MTLYCVYWIKTSEMRDVYREGYVGITKHSPEKRFEQHKKYPVNNKLKEAFETGETKVYCLASRLSLQEAKEIERNYRPQQNLGLNIAVGGGMLPSRLGIKASELTRERLRLSHIGQVPGNKGKKASEETKEKLRTARRKRITSDETRKRQSATNKARGYKPPICYGEENGFFGKKHSEETRLKMRQAWERRKLRSSKG